MNFKRNEALRLLVIFLLCFIFSGCCLTLKLENDILKKRSLFDKLKSAEIDCSSLKIHTGIYAGVTEVAWTPYHSYQFEGLLKEGEDRNLEILIPNKYDAGERMAIVRNNNNFLEKKIPAYLLIKTENVQENCENLLSAFEEKLRRNHTDHGIIIDQKTRQIDYYYINASESGKNKWLPLTTYFELNKEQVDKLSYRYFYTFPLDIIYFPICLLKGQSMD